MGNRQEDGGTTSERIVLELKDRVARARAAGAYADDLSEVELQKPGAGRPTAMPVAEGFDLEGTGPRVRFRPELGFSSKPVVGPAITFVKRVVLRLQLHVFEDLAQQTDAAIARVETAVAVEAATRERLEGRLEALEARLAGLEAKARGDQDLAR